MKKQKSMMAAAGIMVLVIFLISILSVRAATDSGSATFFFFFGKAKLRNTVEIPLSEAEQLEVLYSNKNLKVYPAEDDTILIKEYLLNDKKEAQAEVTYGTSEDGRKTVTVNGSKTSNIVIFGIISEGERIEVYIPKEGIEALALQTSSGNITAMEDFTMQTVKLSVKANSGNIKWHDTESEELHIQTSSGNITLEQVSGEMTVQAGSGNIKIDQAAGNAAFKTGSGNITVGQFQGQGRMEAGSGNIHVSFLDVTGDMDLQTGSGNVRAELPEELSFRFEAETGSGNINTFFDDKLTFNKKGNQANGKLGENPACLIHVKTGSGNIKVTDM